MKQYIEELKIIFIHVPKTGGSYVEKNMLAFAKEIDSKYTAMGGHTPYKFYLNEQKFENYTAFAVVRHPYDKMISTFNHYKNPQSHQFERYVAMGKPNTIELFVEKIKNEMNENHPFFATQYDWLNFEGRLPIIVKYEYFKQGAEYLATLCNNPELNRLFKKLSDGHHPNIYNIKSELNPQTIKTINNLYHKDFEYFRYDKLEI